MAWKKILRNEYFEMNEALKQTNASFFQYPYYAEGYKYILRSKSIYLKYTISNSVAAYCTIMEIGIWPFKVGLIIRGPVLIDYNINLNELFNGLQQYAKQAGYMFLRINPNEAQIDKYLSENNVFIQEDYFPYYKGSQNKNFNISNKPTEDLLASFNQMCRRKIKHAEAVDFTYKYVETETELKQVYDLFTKVGNKKNFKYRAYKSYKEIYDNGKKHDLCTVYIALLNTKIIAAGFIVKDKNYYNYLSGGLIVDGYESKNSPSAKLHYLAMQDCFEKEDKMFYNISYSGPDSDVYKFKSSFNPEVEDMPDYYTFISNKWATSIFRALSLKNVKKVRKFIRSITK
ncbi:MAG: GNAT family N-acetyltransferase [Chitinophagaceae bacterium]|nr:GNAT family N-acetyltransferase [Chitinophagaceae bacterium]MBP9739066.1 GNAT family N-acetyltransferase [Chitinophagaceae bacterium]